MFRRSNGCVRRHVPIMWEQETNIMGSSSPSLIDIIVQKMAYLNQRQSVLAENVANVDTPGYKARDLAPLTFDGAMKQANITMASTDPRHIIPASMAGVN